MAVIEQPITSEDEARYFQVMTDYNDLMRSLDVGPVPMCHFKAMTQQWDDSHPASDAHWYECEHCGHTEDSAEAWAKVKAREAGKAKPSHQVQSRPADDKELL